VAINDALPVETADALLTVDYFKWGWSFLYVRLRLADWILIGVVSVFVFVNNRQWTMEIGFGVNNSATHSVCILQPLLSVQRAIPALSSLLLGRGRNLRRGRLL